MIAKRYYLRYTLNFRKIKELGMNDEEIVQTLNKAFEKYSIGSEHSYWLDENNQQRISPEQWFFLHYHAHQEAPVNMIVAVQAVQREYKWFKDIVECPQIVRIDEGFYLSKMLETTD